LDSIQASILTVKLKYLNDWNLKRQHAALYYISRLKDNTEFILPLAEPGKRHVYHLFVVRSRNRSKLIDLLDKKNISWGIHYPKPLPFLDAYLYKKHTQGDFDLAGTISNEIISIPIYPEITIGQLDIICDQMLKYGSV
jgi:dTDP-4-amino-4,6-dideoxygalactose transaminase